MQKWPAVLSCTIINRQLFPGKSPKEQKILATDLLEQSGVIWSKRAHELTVEQFGAVTKNYIALMKNN